jgi:hypothetical protein
MKRKWWCVSVADLEGLSFGGNVFVVRVLKILSCFGPKVFWRRTFFQKGSWIQIEFLSLLVNIGILDVQFWINKGSVPEWIRK